MALTGSQKAELRFYCGYSLLDNSSAIARSIDAIDAQPDAIPLVLAELDNCKAIDQQLRDLPVLAKAIKDGAIELRAHYTLGVLQAMGRQAAGRLARYLGCALAGDVFASAGPTQPDDQVGASFMFDPNGNGSSC